jgi:uncharacterized protein (TIGR00255 family)
MTIKSMTGFAREAGVTGTHQWAWEIKTVNGRGLDVRLRTPQGFDDVGEEARQRLQKALSRGMCQLNLTVARARGAARTRINEPLLQELIAAIGRLDLPDGIRTLSLDGLLAVRGVVETEDEADEEAFDAGLRADLRAAIGRLVDGLQRAREGEGAALAEVIGEQLSRIRDLTAQAESCPGRQPAAILARLKGQVEGLLDGTKGLDPTRLHQEAALLATRADIREELDRLAAHVDAARALLIGEGAIGRKLDFLAQEFVRETNTLCAKANDVELSRIGLDLKAAVEQFREQVQNVE